MGKIYESVEALIGRTPLLELKKIEREERIEARLYAKLEYFNPAGSVKDRVAAAMISGAEAKGILRKEAVIIEPTSGNTGVGLASIGAVKGYRTIIVMPDTMSIERRNLICAYGAELVLTDGKKGMLGAIQKAEELAKTIPNSFIPRQFDNFDNSKIHYETTGPEVWEDMEGKIDYFVAGVGTGGTITGVGRYLKEKNPAIQIIAVEPKDSPVLSEGKAGAHKIQGIGAGFVPAILDTNIYDEIVTIENEEAFQTGRKLAQSEGILVGISSGAAVCAAVKLAKRTENKEKNIVALLPDTGNRYLSTPMFRREEM